MSGPCIFCAVATGEVAAPVVFEDACCVAFLDHRPVFLGHTLIVPRRHVETLPECPPELIAPLFGAARLLARAIPEALQADGSFVAINNRVSQSVPHLHVHVVPRRRKDGLRGFFWPRQRYPDDEAREVVRRSIAARIEDLEPGS